ncbi:MAG TPA: protein TolQ [Caulobacteraceae bacterium]|nr:protein TolQ [Caulobacteraceae bacterium]
MDASDALAGALSNQSFSIIAVFVRADWVVKAVLVGLAVASLWSWTVILDKLFRYAALNKETDAFEDQVNSGRSLEEIATEAGERPIHALPRMLQAGLKEWRDARAKGGLTGASAEGQAGLLIQRIDRLMDAIIARESRRIEVGLGALAIVATASPFVGLFGTVWGIMHAFQAIAAQKNTNLAVVAPSIAEALFTTAVGLAAAIPAYIFYNKFSTEAGRYTGRLESFADDLAAAVTRRLAERLAAPGER